jgi:hypothetical protein
VPIEEEEAASKPILLYIINEFVFVKFKARLIGLGVGLVFRLVRLHKCGRFHERQPERRDPPKPWARWLGTEAVLGRQAGQRALQSGYFEPLNRESVHSEQPTLHHELEHEQSGYTLTEPDRVLW